MKLHFAQKGQIKRLSGLKIENKDENGGVRPIKERNGVES
jgi:hypothetical protein